MRILVLTLRPSRRKARTAAVAEVLAILRGLDPRAAPGGPLSEEPGIAWVALPDENLDAAIPRLRGLGYTSAIDLVAPPDSVNPRDKSVTLAKWKGREVALLRVFDEPDDTLRSKAPDQRSFLLEDSEGKVRTVVGYRGGVGALEHRALPVVDARLLVNLVAPPTGGLLLDPFAGAGGVIIEARAKGCATISLDIDPALRFGLRELATQHLVGDAAALPFADASFDAIASEPPYDDSGLERVVASIAELARVTRKGGRIAMLIASRHRIAIRDAGAEAKLRLELEAVIDRKGTEVTCLCWTR